MSTGVPQMGYTYLNLLDLPELLQILVTLSAVTKPSLPNFLARLSLFQTSSGVFEILSHTQCIGSNVTVIKELAIA